MHHLHDKNNLQDEKITNPNTSILKWLQENWVFIAVDLIAHHAAHTVGNLINIHLQITHCTTLKETLFNALQSLKIPKEKVIKMALDAKNHYDQAMDSGKKS